MYTSQGLYYANPHVPEPPLEYHPHYQPVPAAMDMSYQFSPYFQPSPMLPSPLFRLYSHLPLYSPHQPQPPVSANGYRYLQHQPHLPYLTSFPSSSSLDQLNLSRTVVLKNLSSLLTLNDLLNEIEYGPIEYCKMFSRAAPSHLKDVETVQTCYISFTNSKILVAFHLKYAKNKYNLAKLKERLHGSLHLKISLNDGYLNNPAANKQDFIKLKTLNYILEFNATRCLLVRISSACNQDEAIEADIRAQTLRFGDLEDFKISYALDEYKALLHFTSIDAAIKTYEHYNNVIQTKKRDQEDEEDKGLDAFSFTLIAFHKDRCDRTIIDKPRQRSTSSVNSAIPSPLLSKKASSSNVNASIREDDEELDSVLESSIDSKDNLALLKESLDMIDKPLDKEDTNSTGDLTVSSTAPAPALLRHGSFPSMPHPSSYNLMSVSSASTNPGLVSPAYQFNPDPYNIGNRTIFLGNLHPNTTVEEIANNVRAGGLVEHINYHAELRICFITFVDANVALKYYLNHQVHHQLIIHGYDITVGWAKNHSGPLSRDVSLAVTAGASRNVYIGLKSKTDDSPVLPDEEELRANFSKFGALEQINFYHNRGCGFMNFLHIMDAIKVVEMFESDNETRVNEIMDDNGAFYAKYKHFKISFGKDRCGNTPKFSFKKKINHNDPNAGLDSVDYNLFKTRNMQHKQRQRARTEASDEPLGEEAALVFGISTKEEKKDSDDEDDEEEVSLVIEADRKHSYEGKVGSSDSFVPRSRNLSNASLNKKYPGSPYCQFPQQMCYVPGQWTPLSPRPGLHHSNSGYFPPPPPVPPATASFPGGKQAVTSGSQVMAQYLAKSQHDGMYYGGVIDETSAERV